MTQDANNETINYLLKTLGTSRSSDGTQGPTASIFTSWNFLLGLMSSPIIMAFLCLGYFICRCRCYHNVLKHDIGVNTDALLMEKESGNKKTTKSLSISTMASDGLKNFTPFQSPLETKVKSRKGDGISNPTVAFNTHSKSNLSSKSVYLYSDEGEMAMTDEAGSPKNKQREGNSFFELTNRILRREEINRKLDQKRERSRKKITTIAEETKLFDYNIKHNMEDFEAKLFVQMLRRNEFQGPEDYIRFLSKLPPDSDDVVQGDEERIPSAFYNQGYSFMERKAS